MVMLHQTVVDAPDLLSTKHNLMDVGFKDVPQSRWENGVTFNPQGCFSVSTFEVDCPPEEKSASDQTCPDAVTFLPFIVEFGVRYMGHEDEGELERELRAKTSAAVEWAIWEGLIPGTNPKLTEGEVAQEVPRTSRELLAVLEADLYNIGGQGGTVHLSVADSVMAEGALTEKDGKLYSIVTGNPVVVGAYPQGQGAIHGGEIDVYASEEFTFASYDDRKENQIVYKVERLVLAAWNPCFVFTATVTPTP
jgi:hypothetical protein